MLVSFIYAAFWAMVGLIGALAGMAFIIGFQSGKS
jgi:hypothetical protein